ncbi:glycoside hydrolase family 13 protein [Eubacteriales bacterium mix99]|jgi:glycosidase
MNKAAIYHRPDSEYAYLYDKDTMHIRLRTAKGDMEQVWLLHGDPYDLYFKHWYKSPLRMTKILSTDCCDYWLAKVTSQSRRLSYGFFLKGIDDTEIFFGDRGFLPLEEPLLQDTNNYFRMPYFHEIDRCKAPDWVRKTVWYQIFPERFANGDPDNDPKGTLPWGSVSPGHDDFFGGDLQGVIDHLDYLLDLGINGIYFCPIFKAHSNHKYDTIDYFKIDPAFGDETVFKQLVEECHKRGIKVMLDAVFNHIGDRSPQWKDVLKNGADSRYADWFHVNEFPATYQEEEGVDIASHLTYDTFAFTPHMPKLNTANPEVQEYLLSIARFWIEKYDIDAWRLDVANEIDHTFWKKFRKVCNNSKKNFYILGEAWNSSQSWLQGDEFHAVMNYVYTDAILKYFVKRKISVHTMVGRINNQLMLYRDQTNQVQFNILDSHDTPRLLTDANGDKDLMKQVMAFTYIQPGVPCLFYGDEVGLTGGMDPDCRQCMIWEEGKQDRRLFQFVKKLIAVRRSQQKILSEGTVHWAEASEESGIIIYERIYGDTILRGVFNTGEHSETADLNGEVILDNLAKVSGQTVNIEKKGFVLMILPNPPG